MKQKYIILEEKFELRMYSLTLYQLSAAQANIQCGHANVEFGVKYDYPEIYKEWARDWKTVINLNAGTSQMLSQRIYDLKDAGIDYAEFTEPDLYNQVTAVSFIVDERVFNKIKYPDLSYDKSDYESYNYSSDRIKLETNWLEDIGGEKNRWLREWFNLHRFKLAGA